VVDLRAQHSDRRIDWRLALGSSSAM
jgi:hypothetical protein